MLGGVVRLLVHAEHDRHVGIFGGRGNDDLLGPGGDVLAGRGRVAEDAGGLDHDIHT